MASSSLVWILLVSTLLLTADDATGVLLGDSLYVSNGTHIVRIDRSMDNIKFIHHQIGGRIIGLAADIDDGLLFWSDISTGQRAIYRANLDGTDATPILQGVEECYGLSVDWVSNHVYWTDAGKRTVELANYDGRGRRILFGHGLIKPRGIIVDPVFGNVFWADQGTQQIERSGLDGSGRKVLVDQHLHWPNQLAISYPTRRLYWVNGKSQQIMSSDLDGREVKLAGDLSNITRGNPVFGLVTIGNTAVFSTWLNAAVHSTLVEVQYSSMWRQLAVFPGTRELFSLVSTDRSLQPQSIHPCGESDMAGCSHLCLPTRGMSFRCACPSFDGLALSANGKSCEVPSELLFFTLKGSGDVGFISLTGAQSPDLTLAGRSTEPSAVTYDPIDQMVYWSDTKEFVIYRVGLGRNNREVFLNSTHGIAMVDGMAIDWISRRLYFTNTGQSVPSVQGMVFSHHRIEVVALDRSMRKTVVSDVDRPSGLDLDLRNGFLFYGDWGETPRIMQAHLDGSDAKEILDSGLSQPNGLTFYNGLLYVADCDQDNTRALPHLMVYHVANASWEQLKLSGNVSLPMGLAVRGDTLYYTDWVSKNATEGFLKSYDLRFGVDNNVITSGQRPTGLHYSPLARRRQEPVSFQCDLAVCSHECVRVPSSPLNPFRCMCPDESSKVLASNHNTCERPQNFLLFADLSTLKLASLDPESEEGAHTLLYSDIASNFAAVTYDDHTDTIYWSDLTKKAIYSSPFNVMDPSVVHEGEYLIEGLTVDTDRQRLFWTAFDQNGTGLIARLNIQRGDQSYKEIVSDLHGPRAILYSTKKKMLFWTEYGGPNTPASVHRSRANGKHQQTIMSSGLFWPNSLALSGDQLYVGEGSGRVFVMDIEGTNHEELMFLSGSIFHISGLAVHESVLFYSDWYTHAVYMVNLVTGQQETIADHLSRPSSVVIYHPAKLEDSSQCGEDSQCSHVCMAVPRGFHCTCPVGSRLSEDGKTCKQLATPWMRVEDSYCHMNCHGHAVCAQLVPLLHFRCVCEAGYEGDGQTCEACPVNTITEVPGNGSCQACPYEATTLGVAGASRCECTDPTQLFVNWTCVSVTSPSSQTTADPDTDQVTGTSEVMDTSEGKDDMGGNDSLTTEGPGVSSMPPYSNSTSKTGDGGKPVKPHVIGQPYFEGCPHGDEMELELPPGGPSVLLPVTWTAKDSYGNLLPVSSVPAMTAGNINLTWSATRPHAPHTVTIAAEDNWKHKVTCQFKVLLKDVTAPVFEFCPEDLVVRTLQNSARTSWQLPRVWDNTGVERLISSRNPGSEFQMGVTGVNYTALDRAGNAESCSFAVTVVQEHQCSLPQIEHGAFMCGNMKEAQETCHITCENTFVVSPFPIFQQSFHCREKEDIARLTTILETQQPCLEKRRPTLVSQEFSLSFSGSCSGADGLTSQLLGDVMQHLEALNLCKWAECHHGNASLICDWGRHRSDDSFHVQWNITVENSTGFSRGQVETILLNIKLELMNLLGRYVLHDGRRQFQPIQGSVHTAPILWLCRPGEVVLQDGCVACPAGSRYLEEQQECELCPIGSFQPQPRQPLCLQCARGATREVGANASSLCVSFPSIDEMSKFLIITACTFGFVFLCMVIFMYLQYQRQQKAARKTLTLNNHARHLHPNIYVAPPPIPKPKPLDNLRRESRDYIGFHDYEDIDGAANAKAAFEALYRIPPGQRDSINSFRTASDIIYRNPASPTPRSFIGNDVKGSENIFVPGSPTEGKAYKLTNDAYFKSAMSPHGTSTINSFKSSPESPYHSPHFGHNTIGSLYGREMQMRSPHQSPHFQHNPSLFSRMTPDPLPPQSPLDDPNDFSDGDHPFLPPAPEISSTFQSQMEYPYRPPPPIDSPSFRALGDTLYKRPPSPISPTTSSRVSSDSLYRSSLTPRGSPLATRARFDGVVRTPPRRPKRSIADTSCYEYD